MPKYAAKTEVSVEKSRMEVEQILSRYGAKAFSYGWDAERAIVAFLAFDRQVRFELPMPDKDDPEITHYVDRYGYKQERSAGAAEKELDQAKRQRWRALALVIKAKLEAVECGISEFEDEFLANIVLPDGSTVGSQVRGRIKEAYDSGVMPTRLLLGEGGKE